MVIWAAQVYLPVSLPLEAGRDSTGLSSLLAAFSEIGIPRHAGRDCFDMFWHCFQTADFHVSGIYQAHFDQTSRLIHAQVLMDQQADFVASQAAKANSTSLSSLVAAFPEESLIDTSMTGLHHSQL